MITMKSNINSKLHSQQKRSLSLQYSYISKVINSNKFHNILLKLSYLNFQPAIIQQAYRPRFDGKELYICATKQKSNRKAHAKKGKKKRRRLPSILLYAITYFYIIHKRCSLSDHKANDNLTKQRQVRSTSWSVEMIEAIRYMGINKKLQKVG